MPSECIPGVRMLGNKAVQIKQFKLRFKLTDVSICEGLRYPYLKSMILHYYKKDSWPRRDEHALLVEHCLVILLCIGVYSQVKETRRSEVCIDFNP